MSNNNLRENKTMQMVSNELLSKTKTSNLLEKAEVHFSKGNELKKQGMLTEAIAS
ncbi:MAG: hypothetical protein QNJ53_11420 [Pleurocapsa sp. MO_192.B19]|nr:hypothetical protein [Pleurocapsa sp. MO_192.B19]